MRYFLAGLILSLSSICFAQEETSDKAPDEVLFFRDGNLQRGAANGKGKATAITGLATKSAVRLSLSKNKQSGLLQTESEWLWFRLDQGKAELIKRLQCAHARITRSGKCVLCFGADGVARIYELRGKPIQLGKRSPVLDFAGGKLVGASGDALFSWVPGKKRSTKVAPHHPESDLLIAPNRIRAVGVYTEGKGQALFSFKLDGKSARRRLLDQAKPIQWSANSSWLLVQGKGAACVVRGVGGEYKCWDGYLAVGLSDSGDHVFLSKETEGKSDLYRAPITGTRPAKPTVIWSKTTGTAAAALH